MKTTRHSLKALAAGALALCLTLTTLPAAGAALSDAADSDWYAQAVQYCWDNGMIEDNGDGTFSPNSPMTRAMVAYALYVISDRPEVDLTPEEHESGAADDEGLSEVAASAEALRSRAAATAVAGRALNTPSRQSAKPARQSAISRRLPSLASTAAPRTGTEPRAAASTARHTAASRT